MIRDDQVYSYVVTMGNPCNFGISLTVKYLPVEKFDYQKNISQVFFLSEACFVNFNVNICRLLLY